MSRIGLARTLVAAIVAANAASVHGQPEPSKVRPAPPSPNESKTPANVQPPITLAQFEQAAQIASLAAEREMYELSQRAIRRALANGPPIDVQMMSALGRPKPRTRIRAGTATAASPTANIEAQVVQTLDMLVQRWQKAPPEEVYQTLLGIVMPEGRPQEIFLYEASAGAAPQIQPFRGGFAGGSTFGSRRVRGSVRSFRGGVQWPGVSRLLVDAAVRAAQVDDLQRRISARTDEHAEFAATILLAQLALVDGRVDAAACWPYLERLAKHDPPVYAEQLLRELTPNIEVPDLPAEMVAWLETKLEQETVESRRIADDPTWLKLLLSLARWQFAKGNVEQARRHLKSYAEHGTGGESNAEEQERYLLTRWLCVSREFISAGLVDDALDALATYIDGPDRAIHEPLLAPVWLGLRRLLLEKTSASERYKRLAAWTMPPGERRQLRFVGCFVPRDGRPRVFQTALYRSWPDDVIASNFQLLVAAAREARLLDDLKQRLEAYADDQDVEAVALGALLAAETGGDEHVAAMVERMISSQRAAPGSPEAPRQLISAAAYLLIRTCLRSAPLRRQGEVLAELSELYPRQWTDRAFSGLMDLERMSAMGGDFGLGAACVRDPAFIHWQVARAGDDWLTLFNAPVIWGQDDNCLRCFGGGAPSALVLDFPLLGSGEISVDVGRFRASGTLSYGGISVNPYGLDLRGDTFPATVMENRFTTPNFRLKSGLNCLTLHFEPEANLALNNGEIVCDIPRPSPAAPWLALCSWSGAGAAFDGLTITGDWWIPREVTLVEGDRYVGWSSGFYERPVPRRVRLEPANAPSTPATPPLPFARSPRLPTGRRGFTQARSTTANGAWRVHGGTLNGLSYLRDGKATPSPSRLTYLRPLRRGDVLRYEFYYQQRKSEQRSSFPTTMVYPALDRLTFLLEAEGVRLHWMTNHPDLEAGDLPLDNVADEPAARRGPAPLPLADGDWNRVAIRLIDDEVLIELNGVLVFQRKLESTNDRLFSFFHYHDKTQALIRN
ncbi:MAG TPA: DUF1583 domain-containing protein, partial [Pirellulales bacterium]|nr:DUF1583 domain-containing protein [Pirellulales bacterium]